MQWSVGPGWQAVFGTLSPSPRLWPRELEATGARQWAWTRWERVPQVAALDAPSGDWRRELRRQGWWPWDVDGVLHTWWQPLEGRGLCLAADRVLVGEMRQVGRLLEDVSATGARPGVPRHCPVHGAALDWRRSGTVEGVLRDAGVAPDAWPAWIRMEFCRVDQQVQVVVLLPPGEATVGMAALDEAWTRLPGAAPQWTCRTPTWMPVRGCQSTVSLQGFGLRMGWVAQWLVGADERR